MGLFNLARMTVSSSGTGNITLNAAVSGLLTFDLAGCSTASAGQVVTYAISDTTQSEIATGVYYSSSLTVTRGSSTADMKSTNGNSPINMSNAAQVLITPGAFNMPAFTHTTVYSTNGTHTAHSGLIYAVVECIGGGGGGGVAFASSAIMYGGGGGGSGSYSRSILTSSQIGTSQTVTVGSGGAAGGAGGNGGNGGATSFGALVTAGGGLGGTWSGSSGAPNFGRGGAGGTAGTGVVSIAGAYGDNASGSITVTVESGIACGGAGGGGVYGVGGQAGLATNTNKSDGLAGAGYGGGGGGGAMNNSPDDGKGGAGAGGAIIVVEYCSQ